jgi:hypothetical protein
MIGGETRLWSGRALGGLVVRDHLENRGYGANQETCYRLAVERGIDFVVLVQPDYQ